uniref:Uncharacterized protein n=1 Tax=Timema genevievae TaxID=629358 RepID=A0A7R9K1D6_TIMGE|nr:unnamed protein product [Timema genevievae]
MILIAVLGSWSQYLYCTYVLLSLQEAPNILTLPSVNEIPSSEVTIVAIAVFSSATAASSASSGEGSSSASSASSASGASGTNGLYGGGLYGGGLYGGGLFGGYPGYLGGYGDSSSSATAASSASSGEGSSSASSAAAAASGASGTNGLYGPGIYGGGLYVWIHEYGSYPPLTSQLPESYEPNPTDGPDELSRTRLVLYQGRVLIPPHTYESGSWKQSRAGLASQTLTRMGPLNIVAPEEAIAATAAEDVSPSEETAFAAAALEAVAAEEFSPEEAGLRPLQRCRAGVTISTPDFRVAPDR